MVPVGFDPKSEYAKKLLDPRWQKRKSEIQIRDDFTCQACGDKSTTLHVHHRWYERGRDPWDYPDSALVLLCVTCHDFEKDERPSCESSLLRAAKVSGLLAGNVDELCNAIKAMEGYSQREVSTFLSVIHFLGRNPDLWRPILKTHGLEILKMVDPDKGPDVFKEIEARRAAAGSMSE
jgi:hypothetical protein